MPRPRVAQFIDSSAARANAGDSDRAPRIRDRKQAQQYNANQQIYANALATYAASAATVVQPQFVQVPAASRRKKPKPVMAVISQPVLPGNAVLAKAVRVPGAPTKATIARKAAAARVTEFRRAQPGRYAFSRSELANVERLVDGGVNALTWCPHDKRKTQGYDAVILKVKRVVKMDGTLGVQRWRMASKCRDCHSSRSTLVSAGPNPPATVHGGQLD